MYAPITSIGIKKSFPIGIKMLTYFRVTNNKNILTKYLAVYLF